MQSLIQDLRYAVRNLAKSPGFALAAILTLGIGIGANTAIYSLMDAVVLHPLDVPALDRVMTVGEQQAHGDYEPVSLANFEDLRAQNRSFEALAARTMTDRTLTGAGDAAHVLTAGITGDFFGILRATPLKGRVFAADEYQPGRDAEAVLNYGFWQRQFGADPNILGRHVEMDQRVYTIVGVMPKSLQYPSVADLFVPLAPTAAELANRGAHQATVIGRLRDGVSMQQAQADLRGIAARLAQQYPATNAGRTVKVDTLLDQVNSTLTNLYFRMVLGATLFVLLVVCANVANLQFARGIARRPEVALRTALGASRWRLLRQLLTENLLLGLAGAVLGIGFAAVDLHISLMAMPERVARWLAGWSRISLNGRVLAFSILIAVAAGVVSGLTPALQALRLNLVDQLKSGSRGAIGSAGAHRLRSVFAVAQIALAVSLVIGAALMAKGMVSMLHFADEFHPREALTFTVALPAQRYDTPQKLASYYTAAQDRLRALPGVKHATLTLALPYSDQAWLDDVEIESQPRVPGRFQSALHETVGTDYFPALAIKIVEGRALGAGDKLGTTPVAVVSRNFAQHYFPNQNALGKKVRMGADRGSKDPWLTIVGVAENVRYSWWDQNFPETVYMSAAQVPPQGAMFTVFTEGDPMALAPSARKALAQIDPLLALDAVQTYEGMLHESLTGLMYAAGYLAFDALVALLLAAIGIFAVMANQVAERTREIGVRLAMGARREDVLRMMLGKTSLLTGGGLAVGLVLAVALARMSATLLAGVKPNDPLVFVTIPLAVALMGLLAGWLPARRAASVDPMVALRED